jgi:hypothetical protein
VGIKGKVIDKVYVKRAKCFVFRIKTEKEFDIKESGNAITEEMIFQLLISKKLHRKYRKIIYNGNELEVFGALREHDVAMIGKNLLKENFIIEVHRVREYKEQLPDLSKMPGINKSPKIPSETPLEFRPPPSFSSTQDAFDTSNFSDIPGTSNINDILRLPEIPEISGKL